MLKNTLNSISPLDGRYATKLGDLEQYFSEFALIKNRVLVEINWLIFMSQTKSLSFVPTLSKNKETSLLKIIDEFSLKDAEQIKKIEAKTNHDVKAVEVFIGKKLKSDNIYFAGIDFIDQKLNGDINVTSPTGLKTYYDLSKINLAKIFWKGLRA